MGMTDEMASDFMEDWAKHGSGALHFWLKEHPEHAREIIDLSIDLDADATLAEPTAEEISHARLALRKAFHQVLP